MHTSDHALGYANHPVGHAKARHAMSAKQHARWQQASRTTGQQKHIRVASSQTLKAGPRPTGDSDVRPARERAHTRANGIQVRQFGGDMDRRAGGPACQKYPVPTMLFAPGVKVGTNRHQTGAYAIVVVCTPTLARK